ncbi:MAG TPA: trigger factor [Epsilonproteobacteria bacterium]|nr:trigger factor [Campylobacterota bacterium]
MKVTVKKVDDANIIVSGVLDSDAIDANIEKLAKQAAKEIKVDGFRAGKVPVAVVKQMHGEKLAQDAEGEALRELIDAGLAEAKISAADMLGQPGFKKYEKTDKGIEVEVEISTRPNIDTKGYMDAVPSFKKPKAAKKDVDAKLKEMAEEQAPFEKIARKRAVKDGDMTVIDFEGFVDGVAFDGGKAEKFNLKIGSGQFIPGFEEQIIGMKYEEEKDVVVNFPKEYQAAELAGKEATFKVKLHEIQEQKAAEIDDALAQKLLNDEKATLKELTEKVEAQVETAALSKVYNEEIKPKLVEALVKKFDFALPNNIVEQEIDAKINAKAQEMSEDELAEYKDNEKKINELRDSVREDATASVKATFIVDALAKEENITVDDQEVSQAIYYEAMMSGQDPQQVIKYYEENNLLPAVKMGMIEDKLFGKMLGLDK